jgi:hypothetical protein
MAKNKVPNSKKLENLLAKWPDLSDYPIRVKEADQTARLMLDNLIKVVKQDEQIAKELEEINQFKLKF